MTKRAALKDAKGSPRCAARGSDNCGSLCWCCSGYRLRSGLAQRPLELHTHPLQSVICWRLVLLALHKFVTLFCEFITTNKSRAASLKVKTYAYASASAPAFLASHSCHAHFVFIAAAPALSVLAKLINRSKTQGLHRL